MFTLIQEWNRDQDILFPTVQVLFPVSVPVLFLYSVNKRSDVSLIVVACYGLELDIIHFIYMYMILASKIQVFNK